MLVANIELKKPKKIDGTIVNDIPPPSPRPSTPVDRTGTQESSDSVNVVSPSTSAITAGTTETRKYYLVRSCRSIPPEHGVIGVGWDKTNFSEMGNAEQIIKSITPIGRWSNQIRRFKAIRKGDVIVVPHWGGTVLIGEAMGEELYDARYSGQDGCNQQKVRFARDPSGKEVIRLPRRNLPEGLQRRLKIRITVADLAEFQSGLDSALAKLDGGETYVWSAENARKQLGLKEDFKRQLLDNVRGGKTGLSSGGIGLERLVEELLRIDGFYTHLLGKRTFMGYGDADIKASKTDRLHTEEFLIQVKHHGGETGRWGLQQLLEIKKLMPDEYSDYQLVLVTTAAVGEKDKEHARENDIIVLNGGDLAEWIYDSIRELSPETKIALGISEVPQILA